MGDILQAIGFVGTALGIFGFFKTNLPSNAPNGAVVRIKVGNQDYDGQNYGGGIARVIGYDQQNRIVGNAYDKKISNGDFQDITLDQDTDGIQSKYIGIIATGDAICISWITLKNRDGASDSAWIGDVGKSCGQDWAWGNQEAGYVEETGERISPSCTWLDADHTNDIISGAMKINFSSYADNLDDAISSGRACSATSFSDNAGEIDGAPGKKRDVSLRPRRPESMTKRIIISTVNPAHNATELCTHPTSHSSDVVGSDGYYCNMETRELHPLCSSLKVDGCVSIDIESGKVQKRTSLGKRTANVHYRSYEKVSVW
ncbi:hypothetical protein V492_05317 [Pseudogymnoascus sp. VKM F-4246]|nr:hypothetical protein V492_05317 [Pseudogymnoascus sp. VKM F-4246]